MALQIITALLPILFPFLSCFALFAKPFKDRKKMRLITIIIVVITALLALYAIYFSGIEKVTIYKFADNMSIAIGFDGLSKFFGTMVSLLWVATTVYAFEYMSHEKSEQRFFAFFIMSFGAVLGIAFSANMLTMYLFYEFLTLSTLPLVMHEMDSKAYHAAKTYIAYMMFGASFAFIGLVIVICYSNNIDFRLGGVLDPVMVAGNENILRFTFVLAFFGFGVKAAIFPLYYWLPTASVAPTPVTALLHAVAVVKSGVFAIMRLTYFCFGINILKGSWAQNVMMGTAMFTIVFGSLMALKTSHVKRRFAYSTMSNLSYIIFSLSIMSSAGLAAGLMHMLYHAVVKITIFFCIGSILVMTKKEYVKQLEGLGLKMPIIFTCFFIVGLGLVGIPPFVGFHSKWNIAQAAVMSGNKLAYLGAFVLIVSALLTALYLFTVIIEAFFPKNDMHETHSDQIAKDPPKLMTGPIIALTIVSVILAFTPSILVDILRQLILNSF